MSSIIPTPHIEAKKGDFAETVIMPGDLSRRPVQRKNALAICTISDSIVTGEETPNEYELSLFCVRENLLY